MDINSLKIADSAALHVKNVDGEPLYDGADPVRIILHSPGSKAFATVEARQSARAVRRMNENDGRLIAPTAEERQQETIEDLADLTIAFEHLSCGEKSGRDLFAAVYGDPRLGYITRQVSKTLGNWGAFKRGSATS